MDKGDAVGSKGTKSRNKSRGLDHDRNAINSRLQPVSQQRIAFRSQEVAAAGEGVDDGTGRKRREERGCMVDGGGLPRSRPAGARSYWNAARPVSGNKPIDHART